MNYTVEQVYSWLYRIYEPLNVCFYIIVGDDRALVFDTGHGIINIREAVEKITTKPITVILGHAHVDHANGAFQFDEVYLHEEDFELFKRHTAPQFRNGIIDDIKKIGMNPTDFVDPEKFLSPTQTKLLKLEHDTVFNLGGLDLKVINMAGHTRGSIGLLALQHKKLLVSDAANEHIWMFFDESTSVGEYINTLERVYKLDFDMFFTGHSDKPYPKSELQKFINVAREATMDNAIPYSPFEGIEPYFYELDGATIVFTPDKL